MQVSSFRLVHPDRPEQFIIARDVDGLRAHYEADPNNTIPFDELEVYETQHATAAITNDDGEIGLGWVHSTEQPADPTSNRILEFATGALAALTDEQRAECQLLAELDPGMRLRPAEDDPETIELLWGGAVIAITTALWLNTGETGDE